MTDTNQLCPHLRPFSAGCRICKVLAGTHQAGMIPVRQKRPCMYRDDVPVGAAERERLHLSHWKDWRECLHENTPLGRYVCSCGGCGVNCPGFAEESE